MALQGYKTKVNLSGTPTTLTSEPMSAYSTVPHTYQANTSTKRIFSSTAALTFKTGSHTISASEIVKIDYLFGAVTLTSAFAGSTVFTGTIKATGKYLPVTPVAGGHAYQLTQKAELYDNTDYTSTGWRSRVPGLKDISVSVSRFDNVDLAFYSLINSGTPAILEIRPGGTGKAFRGWFVIESEKRDGAVGALEASDLSFQLYTPLSGSSAHQVPFEFNTP